jgi:hypothetical protein
MAPTSITTHHDRRHEKLRRTVRIANRHATPQQQAVIRHLLEQHAQGNMTLADAEHVIVGICYQAQQDQAA